MTFILLLVAVAIVYVLVRTSMRERKRVDSILSNAIERWGNQASITSFDELEQWWDAEESKDAQIRKLESELKKYQDRYSPHLDLQDTFDTHRLRLENNKLRAIVNELETKDRNSFVALLPNGPTDIPDNPLVMTTFYFRGKELTEWEQHMEQETHYIHKLRSS